MRGLGAHKLSLREKTLATEAMVDTANNISASANGLSSKEDDLTLMQTYEKSIWVYNAVTMIAEVAAQIPLKIYRRTSKTFTDLTYEKNMAVFRHPNPLMSRFRLWEASISFLRSC